MINYKLRLFIYIYFLMTIFSSLFGQNLSIQYDYANNLFNSELYFDAITEYKRLIFFDNEKKYDLDANYRIGLSYKMGAKYNEAIKYFSSADLTAENDSQRVEIKYQIIRTNILRRTTERSLFLLDDLSKEYKSIIDTNDINYWRGWTYMFADEWEQASGEFGKINSAHSLKLLCDRVYDDKYSVTFAKLISYILPGSGQFYTGNYVSGLLSLGWNVLWGYLTITAFMENRALDGILIGSLLWLRFYRGNFQNAEQFAIEKNIEISNDALRYLKNNYKGIKP